MKPDIQRIIDKAVKIATKQALSGHPVASITWIPPAASGQQDGSYMVTVAPPVPATATPPWET